MKIFTTLVASSLAFCQLAHAWDYSSTDAAAVATPADAHETFTKTWTVSGDNVLSELTVNSFGRVFIDYDASLASGDGARTVAKIVFSGNSTTLLDAFEVVDADDNTNGIKIRVKNEDLEDHAYFLTQIYVSGKQAITSIGQVWSCDLVIGDDVLVQNNSSATLDLALAGSGDVYAGSPSTEFSLNALNVVVAGSGDIQVLAKCLDVNSSLSVNIAGSGDIGVVADTIKSVNDISAAVAGSGDVFVQAGSLTTYNLTSVIGGSGSITYSKDGTAQEQSVAIAGSGDVASASIKAVNTEVSIVGSGDVLVQTTGNLNVSTVFSSGDIRYYGAKPSAINVESSLVFGSHKKKHVVKEAKKNHFEEYEVQSLPARKAIFVAVKLDKSFFSSQPNVKYLIEVESESDWFWHNALINNNIQFNAMQSFNHPHSLAIFAIVGVAFAAVGVAVRKYQRRQERARYAPLV